MNPFVNQYNTVSVPKLQEAFNYGSTYSIPKITKVVLNIGVGDVMTNNKAIDEIAVTLGRIAGQKPVLTKATKAIAGFKIRQGMTVGMKVTLRGERMFDFLAKLNQIALPRTRDFRGLKFSGITADGNLNIGIRDSLIFPETDQDSTIHGIQVTIVSTAGTIEESRLLYTSLGFVFQEESETNSKN